MELGRSAQRTLERLGGGPAPSARFRFAQDAAGNPLMLGVWSMGADRWDEERALFAGSGTVVGAAGERATLLLSAAPTRGLEVVFAAARGTAAQLVSWSCMTTLPTPLPANVNSDGLFKSDALAGSVSTLRMGSWANILGTATPIPRIALNGANVDVPLFALPYVLRPAQTLRVQHAVNAGTVDYSIAWRDL